MRAAAVLFLGAAAAGCASRGGPGGSPILDARSGRAVSFEAMADDLARVRMVFVGESHDNPEHHDAQLRVLRALADRRPHLLLGMEMFERPVQPVLDRFVAGDLDEGRFLRACGWFREGGVGTGWNSDWSLYRDLLRFARSRGIRVVALNAEKAVSSAVGRGGLADLDPWLRAKVPADIDLSNGAHRKSIFSVLGGHPGMGVDREAMLQRMYEGQCVWDETMAESAVRALAEDGRPDAAIVVLAGAMHVLDFHAIPERARRRNGLPYLTVVPLERAREPEGATSSGAARRADFVWWTGDAPGGEPGRLGVGLRGGDGAVKEVAKGSAAEEVGLRPGDVLLSLDGTPVRDFVDLRLALDGARAGRVVTLRWSRGGEERISVATLRAPPEPAAPVPPAPPPAPSPTPEKK